MTDAEIAELRAGLEGVTPGPWTISASNVGRTDAVGITASDDEWVVADVWSDVPEMEKAAAANAAHIARCSPDKIAALLARLDAAEGGWQDIATAPVDGTRILATGFNWNDESKGRWSEILSWEDGDWTTDNGESVYPPTHWMPLPSFPKAGG